MREYLKAGGGYFWHFTVITGGTRGRGKSGHGPNPVCQWDLPPPRSQPAMNFAWTNGPWTIYSTCRADIRAEFLNLLSLDVSYFQESKWSKCVCARALPRRPWGDYSASQTLYSWNKKQGMEREWR